MSLKDHYELYELGSEESLAWFKDEISGLRSGRVTPAIVEGVTVEYYGARSPLSALGSISNSDARTLVISPWDAGSVDAIAKAITLASVGANPNVDGEVIRLVFPDLTEETREETIKIVHKRAEETRVRLRQVRDEALRHIKEEKEKGDLTEDDFFEGKKKLDDLIGESQEKIESMQKAKEKDIRAL